MSQLFNPCKKIAMTQVPRAHTIFMEKSVHQPAQKIEQVVDTTGQVIILQLAF